MASGVERMERQALFSLRLSSPRCRGESRNYKKRSWAAGSLPRVCGVNELEVIFLGRIETSPYQQG